MKIEEAIELLADYKMQSAFEATPAFEAALGLGIEALRFYQSIKIHDSNYKVSWLPGQTEE